MTSEELKEFDKLKVKWFKVTPWKWQLEIMAKPPYDEPVLVVNDEGLYAIAVYKESNDEMYPDEWNIMFSPYDNDIWDIQEHGVILAWSKLPEVFIEEEPA